MSDDPRFNRLENAIEKLTTISADLNKLIAVHEQRIVQNEKEIVYITTSYERKNELFDNKVNELYETIHDEDDKIISKFEDFSSKLNIRLEELEKNIWKLMGGLTLAGFVVAYGPKVLSIFLK